MKRIKSLILVSCAVVLISCNKDDTETVRYEDLIRYKLECMNMPRPEGSYNYPVYPGMPEWSNFKSSQEMVDACEVPVEVLKKQSTQAIIQAIWEYPFYPEITMRSDYYQMDFETVISQTNAYKELVTRNNAGQCLIQRLILANPLIEKAIIEPLALQLVISQTVFISQLSNKEKKMLVGTAFKKDSLRETRNDDPTTIYRIREVTWLLIGRTMKNADYNPFLEEINRSEHLEHFLATSELYYIQNMNEYIAFIESIISHGKNFIKP